ncbi:hypothetical protein AB5I41_20630 [Sphingomonas sp. MMS24-JH45]
MSDTDRAESRPRRRRWRRGDRGRPRRCDRRGGAERCHHGRPAAGLGGADAGAPVRAPGGASPNAPGPRSRPSIRSASRGPRRASGRWRTRPICCRRRNRG